MSACDLCFDGRHLRCGGRGACTCNVCASWALGRKRRAGKQRRRAAATVAQPTPAPAEARTPLTPAQDVEILEALGRGAPVDALVEAYGVSRATIYRAANRADEARRTA